MFVKAERDLIETGLQMPIANSVVNAIQSGLEVGKSQMSDRQVIFHDIRATGFRNGMMVTATLA